jgi:NAD(P)-dependent dehydrogenase (short-subunit alcohol dehydrogenase family)
VTADAVATAIVTGGEGDIGSALVDKLVADGLTVVSVDAAPPTSDDRHAVQADLADADECAAAIGAAIERLGSVDCLVNCTGYLSTGAFSTMPTAETDRVLEANLLAPMNATRAVLPAMLERRAGLIVNVASVWALGGGEARSVYAAAKHAVLGFSRSLAVELRGTGVTVVTLSPGPVRTKMLDRPGIRELYRDDELFEASEVAELVSWILHAPTGLLHGANIVCGRSQPPMFVN